jgi:hypothetical protein
MYEYTKAVARVCNYNPLVGLSWLSCRLATAGVDGILDHDKAGDIFNIITIPIAMPIGVALVSLELAIDFLTRPDVARHKVRNLADMIRYNNQIHPARTNDLNWSVQAEADHYCRQSGVAAELNAFETEIQYDFKTRNTDKGANIFLLETREVHELFARLQIPEKTRYVGKTCEKHGETCAGKIVFKNPDPIGTYYTLLSK